MSTDVFNSFWNDPKKQYVYTNLTCANTKSDDELSFNINGSAGEISNNNDVLSSIDLSTISTSLSSYSTSSKIIPANSLLFIGSESFGKSYKKVVFGKFHNELLNDMDWEYYTKIKFSIKWIKNNNCPTTLLVDAQGTNEEGVIDVINDIFKENEINVDASLLSSDNISYDLISFESNKVGYDFYIDNVSYYIECSDSGDFINEENAWHRYPMEEATQLYVPSYKYRNGAFKGIVIKPIFPLYNNDIEEEHKSLKVCHIKDRIAVFVKNNRGDYFKKCLDVYGNHFDINEFNSCILFKDDNYIMNDDLDDKWLNDEENDWVTIENGYNVLRNNYCGLYGYANYATANYLWNNFGDVYMILANSDEPDSNICNLITPVILYNPNNFDIKVDIVTLEE